MKRRLLPAGRKPRRVLAGAWRGLRFELDLADQLQFYVGLFERELQPCIRAIAPTARSVVDVGAGEGAYMLYFLRHSAARAFAFEPGDQERARLVRNLALNGVSSDRVQVSSSFVGSGANGSSRDLNSLVPSLGFPSVIKIDVEGAEARVLAGAGDLLARPDVTWIIETHSLAAESECRAILERAGRKVRVIEQAWWRRCVPERRPCPHNRWLVAGGAR